MNDACAGARRILTIATLLLTGYPALARPLLVPPKQRLSVPQLVQEQSPGDWPTIYGAVAIDGDSLLVSARRVINTNGDRSEGVYLFQRAASGTWSYVKPLVEGANYYPLINGNLAVV